MTVGVSGGNGTCWENITTKSITSNCLFVPFVFFLRLNSLPKILHNRKAIHIHNKKLLCAIKKAPLAFLMDEVIIAGFRRNLEAPKKQSMKKRTIRA